MADRFSVCPMLLGFLCWTTLGMVVLAQPYVSAWIVEPRNNSVIQESDVVHMTCVAYSLNKYHIVEWVTGSPPYHTLRWGRATITPNPRFAFETTERPTSRLLVIQDLTITDVQRQDSGDYVCNVKTIDSNPGDNVLASARVNLSVLYFPRETFPVCFPDGPVTLTPGTELDIRCASEAGNPEIGMDVSQVGPSDGYAWTAADMDGTISMFLDMEVNSSNNGIAFVCSITSLGFPSLQRSCIIGPISVRTVTEPLTEPMIEPTTLEPTVELTTPVMHKTATSSAPAPVRTNADQVPTGTEADRLSTPAATHAQPTGITSVRMTKELTPEPETPPSTMFGTIHHDDASMISTMTAEPTYSFLSFATSDPLPLTPWVPAFITATSALLVSIIIIVILVLCLIKLMKRRKGANDRQSQNPITEPYTCIELQPAGSKA